LIFSLFALLSTVAFAICLFLSRSTCRDTF